MTISIGIWTIKAGYREYVVDIQSRIQQWMFLCADVKHITTALTLIYDNRTGSSVEWWKTHSIPHCIKD